MSEFKTKRSGPATTREAPPTVTEIDLEVEAEAEPTALLIIAAKAEVKMKEGTGAVAMMVADRRTPTDDDKNILIKIRTRN